MTIPKIIHYCWFGKNPIPEKVEKCIISWKKFCPDYEIIQWNEDNYDVNSISYVKDAYKEKKWAFVSDYARLDIVYNYGGIYLDTDVELIKSLDDLLQNNVFLCMEKNCRIATGLGFGGVRHNEVIKELMDIYKNQSFYKPDGNLNLTACPKYTTDYFMDYGYELEDKTQMVNNTLILSSDYFCPMHYKTGKLEITENTYGIHWYGMSWFPESDKHIHETEVKIRSKFPDKISGIVCFLYRKSYRLIEYIKKGILIKKIREGLHK